MMTEISGTVDFEDLVEGLSVTETTDEATGFTKRSVIDWRSTPRGSDLKPAIVIKGERRRNPEAAAWHRSPSAAFGGRDPLGRARPEGQPG